MRRTPSTRRAPVRPMSRNFTITSLFLLVLVQQVSKQWPRAFPLRLQVLCPLSSSTILSKSHGGSSGKDTRHAEHVSSTNSVPDVFTGVELVSRATYINRKRRNWETRQCQSKACKRAERKAKRKLMAKPEISHEAGEQILRSQATRTDENFLVSYRSSHQLALLSGARMCSSANSAVPATLVGH